MECFLRKLVEIIDQFGRKPYLDEYLAEQGKLVFVDSMEKVGFNIKARGQRAEDRGQKTEDRGQTGVNKCAIRA